MGAGAGAGAGGGARNRRGGFRDSVHRARRDAVEGEAHDDEPTDVAPAREERAREAHEADPALAVDVAGAQMATEPHGDVILLVDVAVDERVLQRVLPVAEERVGARPTGRHGEQREEVGDGDGEGR